VSNQPPVVHGLVLEGVDLVVLSVDARPHGFPATLSNAEREIAAALLEGASYAAIAARRGSAARTVANQVAAIFRKIGVRTRAELVIALTR